MYGNEIDYRDFFMDEYNEIWYKDNVRVLLLKFWKYFEECCYDVN